MNFDRSWQSYIEQTLAARAGMMATVDAYDSLAKNWVDGSNNLKQVLQCEKGIKGIQNLTRSTEWQQVL